MKKTITNFLLETLVAVVSLVISAQVSFNPNLLNVVWVVMLFAICDFLFTENSKYVPDWIADLALDDGVVTRVIHGVRSYKSIVMHCAAAYLAWYFGFPLYVPIWLFAFGVVIVVGRIYNNWVNDNSDRRATYQGNKHKT